ncbi:hypothetical protein ACFWN7_07675 [Agromyces sp. NPDC058484]|uniref:hypothetical protein n=1 Tax=Agromyces sp. NPDC058484 TaxID=3346524 RepID=UPI00365DE9C0
MGCRSERRRERERLERIRLLSDEADQQRDIAAGRLTTTMTKASLLLVGAGLIAGSWAAELIVRPFGLLPAVALAFALASAAAALVSLFPRSTLRLKIRELVEQSFEPDAPSLADLQDLILETKTAVVENLTNDHIRRDRWVRVGYVLLGIALVGGAASLSAALLTPPVTT